jgi:hypothetical protein
MLVITSNSRADDRPAESIGRPFAHLNLRQNPFGSLERADWGNLAVLPFCLDSLAAELMEKKLALQFLGHAGRGKSTHLMAIHTRFADFAFTYIGPGQRPQLGRNAVLFVDEFQRLSAFRRRRAYRGRQSVVIGSHEDLTAELVNAGFETRTVQAGGTSEKTLGEILHRRVRYFRRTAAPVPLVSDDAVHALHLKFGDDLRQITNGLYTTYQELSEVRRVEMRDIDSLRR